MRLRYRVGQFFGRLAARRAPGDLCAAAEVLPAAGLELFCALGPGDQRHALQVWRTLRAEGPCPPSLAQAALLHDVGKAGSGLTLVHRSLCVVLDALAPGALRRLAGPGARSWRAPFHAYLYHAEIGARRCAEAGCGPLTVFLVGHHDAGALPKDVPPAWQAALAALRRADERC